MSREVAQPRGSDPGVPYLIRKATPVTGCGAASAGAARIDRGPPRRVPVVNGWGSEYALALAVITRLSVTDFKAFHELEVELRPITVLVGENNSGKSSIMAPLRLLSQTVTSFDSRVPLLLQGELGDFGTYRDVVHGNHRGRPFRIALEFEEDDAKYGLSLEFKYRTVRRELILREVTVTEGESARHLITVSHSKDADRYLITRLFGRPVPAANRSRMADYLRLFHFLPDLVPARRRGQVRGFLDGFFDERRALDVMSEIDDARWFLRTEFEAIDYIGPMRLAPERSYTQTGETRGRIGASGEHWVSILIRELATSARSETPTPMVEELRRWLKSAGLASDLVPEWASDRYFELQLRHPVTGEYENLADVGQANGQVLPVLVGGLRLGEGSMFLVEEPEIHLHPRAQAELGDYFLTLYKRGVWSVIETHSEYLLLRLQQQVAAGDLPASDVVFYYVGAEADGKYVRRLSLDAHGRFVEPIPGGFFPERLEEAKNLARLRGDQMIRAAKAK